MSRLRASRKLDALKLAHDPEVQAEEVVRRATTYLAFLAPELEAEEMTAIVAALQGAGLNVGLAY